MASQWAANLSVVTVDDALIPKRFTIILPFYENPDFLAVQITNWQRWSADVRAYVTVIIVDDGSPKAAALPHNLPFQIRLFRIQEDRPWNWIAARNIGAHHAEPGWLLLTDIDHVVHESTADALIHGQHNPNLIYAFSRREHTGEAVTPHSASFFMTRDTFWRIGGYDESLSGHYGSDGDFRRRAAKCAPFQVLTNHLVRYEMVGDSSTTRYARKLPQDSAAVTRIVASRSEHWTPKTLSFPYAEVSL